MTLTQQQAIEWAGTATADQLTALPPSPHPRGRLTVQMALHLLSVSTRVAHCFVNGGAQPPILTGSRQADIRCHQILRRDEDKRETLEGARHSGGSAHPIQAQDDTFLKGFGTEDDITLGNGRIPFLRLMFDPETSAEMHNYISEAVRWMMNGGTARNNFKPLLWAGLRDWDSSSAWTRGVVLLYAQGWKKMVEEAHQRHQEAQQQIMNNLLIDLGCHPEQQQQLHSLAHLPSLTARQARRSGVSQVEVRVRWGQ